MFHASKIGYWQGLPYRSMALIGLTLRQMFVNRVFWIAPLFLLLPCAIAGYLVWKEPAAGMWADVFTDLSLFLYLQFFVLFFPLLLAGSIFTEEMEKRTATYLMIKPLKRFEVVVFKYIGMVLGQAFMFVPALTLLFMITMVRKDIPYMLRHLELLGWMLFVVMTGIAAYSALFTAASVLFRRPLIFGLLFAFIWEVLVVNLPGSVSRATITYYLRSVLYNQIYRGGLTDYTDMASTTGALVVLFLISASCLGLACILITYKDMH